jgi:uncharacterized protein
MMKRFPKVAGALLAIIVVLCANFAQAEYPPEGTISTQGHGEIKVKPDSLSFNMMVEATHADLPTARDENNRKMQAIIKALKALNIPNLHLETRNVQVYPMQGEYLKNQLPRTLGYRVINGLFVTVNKADSKMLGLYGSKLADAALSAGASHLEGMGFYLEDMTEARRQALQAAVRDARQNADAMAKAAGLNISGVHSLEGTPQYTIMNRHTMSTEITMRIRERIAAGGIVNSNLPVEPGEEVISSDVTVRFKF